MKKLSYKVSLGGIMSALCILLMFLTAVFPPLNITIPIFTGLLIAMVSVETGAAWAFATYGSVAVLSMFVTPDKEAAIIFIMFFGYYPVLQQLLDRMKNRPLRFVLKLAVFNVSIISAYFIIINFLGMTDLFSDFEGFGAYMVPALILFGNVIFLFYDYVMRILVQTYTTVFRPRFLRKINRNGKQ